LEVAAKKPSHSEGEAQKIRQHMKCIMAAIAPKQSFEERQLKAEIGTLQTLNFVPIHEISLKYSQLNSKEFPVII
jgi:hypothetical protein